MHTDARGPICEDVHHLDALERSGIELWAFAQVANREPSRGASRL